jgi:hypothetical protein
MINLFNFESTGAGDQESRRRVRAWAAVILGARPEDVLTVSELRCGEDACADLETLIVLTPAVGVRRVLKVAKGVSGIEQADLLDALSKATSMENPV